MKTIKVSEVTPTQLDWLVARCEGLAVAVDGAVVLDGKQVRGPRGVIVPHGYTNLRFAPSVPQYSTDWAQGGPIIYRECIATYASGACSVAPKNPDYWVAEILDTSEMITQYGPTPLIAAMRCYVASKMGDTVEIPEKLK